MFDLQVPTEMGYSDVPNNRCMKSRSPSPRGVGVLEDTNSPGRRCLWGCRWVPRACFLFCIWAIFSGTRVCNPCPNTYIELPKANRTTRTSKNSIENYSFSFFGVGVSPNWSTVPDLDSPWPAEHFAQIFSSQGIPGREIQAKTISNCFSPFSGTSGATSQQRHRIRNPRIALIILHRLSALGAV